MNNHTINEDFRGKSGLVNPALTPLEIGTGILNYRQDGLYMVVRPTGEKGYSDSQLFDYHGLKRRDLPNKPPLRMIVRAWASHDADQLVGTAGFGFWNQPLMPGDWTVRLPRAVWFFFGSRHSNMAFAKDVPGWGWKAGTIDASKPAFFALAPTAPLAFLLMRIPILYKRLWPIGQRAIGVSEKMLNVKLTEPHTYQLDWLPDSVRFYVDDKLIHQTNLSPRGPLGFVVWMDNQYAIVTPQGQIGLGLCAIPQEQWLALESLVVTTNF